MNTDDSQIKDLESIRKALVERVFKWVFFAACMAVPFFLHRVLTTEWIKSYTMAVLGFFLYLAAFIMRNRIPWKAKALVVHGVFWRFGLLGLFSFGILSPGLLILLMDCILIGMLHTVRLAIWSLVAVALIITGVGAAFITGQLTLPVDANWYLMQVSAWGGSVYVPFVVSAVVVMAVTSFRQSILVLLKEVEEQRAEVERQNLIIEHQATHDKLTGLPTLLLTMDRLGVAIGLARREKCKVAFVILEISGVQEVYEIHGDEAGDAIVKELGQRLKDAVRASDTAGRVGGSEFIVVMAPLHAEDDVPQLTQRLMERMSAPLEWLGQPIEVNCTCGVSVYPDQGNEPHMLRALATTDLYAQQISGKDSCFVVLPSHGSDPPIAGE